jgi:uncharacterized protein involved in outer membrane biogenesis
MRISWRRLLWIFAVTVPFVAGAYFMWSKTRDLSRYQARLVAQVHRVTGRELAARVPLRVLFGRHPALVAEGVTLSNASWGSRPELARVAKVTMYLEPSSLFLGEIKVSRLVLEGADIFVERNEAGDTNLEMLPPVEGSGPRPGENQSLKTKPNPAFPWINSIEVHDSVLTVAQGTGRSPVVLNVADGTLKAPAPNQTLQIEGRFGSPQAAPFQISGTAGSFDGWIRGLPGNIDVQGSFGGGKIAIKGAISVKGTTLQITSEGPDLAAFGPYVQLPLPSGGPYELSAKASTVRSNFKVEVPTLKVGQSELSGEVLFRVDRHDVPTVTVNVDASKIDLAALHAPPATSASPSTSAQLRMAPALSYKPEWLGRSTLSVTARIGELTGLSSKLSNGSISLASSEKRFALRAAASIGAGSAGFDLLYDPAGRFGNSTFTATVSHVPLEDLATLMGFDIGLKDGMAEIDVRLRGTGRSTRDGLNVANGSIDFAVDKGSWPRDGLSGWPTETQRLVGATQGGAPFNCIAGRFEVSGGVANLRRLVVDTPRSTLVGGGFLQLRSEGWEMILAPEARDAAGATLAVPLRLKGGTGRATSGALEPALAKLIIGAGAVPSLVGTFNQLARQTGSNACATMAPKVEALRPGLRAQMPTPAVEPRGGARRPPPRPAQ